MLNRIVMGVAAAAGAAAVGIPGTAAADDPAPPPVPDVNAFAPVSPVDYSVMEGAWYAFGVPDGLTCVLDRQSGGYGCSGAIPGAPGGANIVSGGLGGPPGFANADQPLYGVISDDVKPLAPNTRLSFRTVSCGTDGVSTTCLNSQNQSGFVISPAGSFIVGETNPLLDRPEGTNPFSN